MRVSREFLFAAVADERRQIASLLDGLDAGQLATPSLCAGWDVKTVAVLDNIRSRTSFGRPDLPAPEPPAPGGHRCLLLWPPLSSEQRARHGSMGVAY